MIDLLRNYTVFIIGGGLGALVNWAISFVLTSLLGVHYLVSYCLAQTVNVAVNFAWHRRVTFRRRTGGNARFARFCLMSVVTALLAVQLVWIVKEQVVDRLGTMVVGGYDLNYLVAIVTVTFAVSVVNYLVSRSWIFRVETQSAATLEVDTDGATD